MKKLLGLFMALAIAMPASAELLRNFELTGDVQVIASDVRHNASGEFTTGTNMRVLAGGSFDLAENVRANLMFQYLNQWGSGPTVEGVMPGTIGKSGNDYLDQIRLVEANVEMKELFGWLDMKVGRQFYGDEDSTVMYIGPRYYNSELNDTTNYNYATSIDAVKLAYANDFVNANVIMGELEIYNSAGAGVPPISATGNKHYMYGLDAKFRISDPLSFQLYGYNIKDVGEDYNGFYGGKLTFAPEAFLVSAEYARNHGGNRLIKESHDNPYLLKLDAKLNMDAFTPRAAFIYSKEFSMAFGNYRPGLLMGDLKPTQILAEYGRIYNIGLDYNWEKWNFALDGYAFQDRTAQHSASLEADLVIKYDYNDNIQLFAGAGYIKYNSNDSNTFDAADNTKGQVGVLVRL